VREKERVNDDNNNNMVLLLLFSRNGGGGGCVKGMKSLNRKVRRAAKKMRENKLI
jgi:hypothetical protein